MWCWGFWETSAASFSAHQRKSDFLGPEDTVSSYRGAQASASKQPRSKCNGIEAQSEGLRNELVLTDARPRECAISTFYFCSSPVRSRSLAALSRHSSGVLACTTLRASASTASFGSAEPFCGEGMRRIRRRCSDSACKHTALAAHCDVARFGRRFGGGAFFFREACSRLWRGRACRVGLSWLAATPSLARKEKARRRVFSMLLPETEARSVPSTACDDRRQWLRSVAWLMPGVGEGPERNARHGAASGARGFSCAKQENPPADPLSHFANRQPTATGEERLISRVVGRRKMRYGCQE